LQGRLDNLQQQLEEHDNDPTTNLRGLSAGQTRRVGEDYIPDRIDLIMDEIDPVSSRYCEYPLHFPDYGKQEQNEKVQTERDSILTHKIIS